MKIFKILLILFLFIGCKSKKVTTDIQKESKTENIKEVKIIRDTVWREKIVIKTLPIYSETILDSPCDSLGNLRNIHTVIGSGANKSSISNIRGQLVIRQYIDSTRQQNELIKHIRVENDSLVSVIDTLKDSIKTSETVRTVWPWWIYALIIGCVLFAGLWIYTKFFMPFRI